MAQRVLAYARDVPPDESKESVSQPSFFFGRWVRHTRAQEGYVPSARNFDLLLCPRVISTDAPIDIA